MKLLKSLLMLSIFNVALAVDLEVVGSKSKKINLDEYRDELYLEDEELFLFDEEEDVEKSEKDNYVNWEVEVADSGANFNPFKMSFGLFKDTVFKGNDFKLGFEGRMRKSESGYKSNSFEDSSISGYILGNNFSLNSSYSEKEKELLTFDLRKESEFNLDLTGRINDPIDIAMDIGMNRKSVSSNLEKKDRDFELTAIHFGVDHKFDVDLGKELENEFTLGACYFGDIISTKGSDNSKLLGVVRFTSEEELVFKLSKDLNVTGSLIGEYSFTDGVGFALGANGSVDLNDDFSVEAGFNYEHLQKKLNDLLEKVNDFDVLGPEGIEREHGVIFNLGAHLSKNDMLFVNVSATPEWMSKKVCYEEDNDIEGNPVKLVNLSEAGFFLSLNANANLVFKALELNLDYTFSMDKKKIAFTPTNNLKTKLDFKHRNFFLGCLFNLKSNFYTKNDSKGTLLPMFYTLDLEGGFRIDDNLKLSVSLCNLLNDNSKYKTEFGIDKRKIKIDIDVNF